MSLLQKKFLSSIRQTRQKDVSSFCPLLDFFALPCTQQYYLPLNENNYSDLPYSTPDNFLYLIQICKGPFTRSVNDCENVKVFFEAVHSNQCRSNWMGPAPTRSERQYDCGIGCYAWSQNLVDVVVYALRPIHAEWKWKRKRKYSLMFVVISLILFAFASAFARCERALNSSFIVLTYVIFSVNIYVCARLMSLIVSDIDSLDHDIEMILILGSIYSVPSLVFA